VATRDPPNMGGGVYLHTFLIFAPLYPAHHYLKIPTDSVRTDVGSAVLQNKYVPPECKCKMWDVTLYRLVPVYQITPRVDIDFPDRFFVVFISPSRQITGPRTLPSKSSPVHHSTVTIQYRSDTDTSVLAPP
jgi:hypothetical protein